MKYDIISFVWGSDNRKEIIKVIVEYPSRQWSCSALEELTEISHATVFRTILGLKEFGILKSLKVNKKDILYELSKSPFVEEVRKILDINKLTSQKIAKDFSKKIRFNGVNGIILYGSSVKGEIKAGSDVDILVIVHKHNKGLERELFNIAAEYSSKINRTISLVMMDKKEIKKEKSSR